MSQIDLAAKIDNVIRGLLYLTMFMLPYSSAVVENCVVLSVILWAAKQWSARRGTGWSKLLPASTLNRPIGIFLGLCLLTTAGSVFAERSAGGLLTKILEWFVIYWLVLDVFKKREHVIWALAVMSVTAVTTAFDGIIQFHLTGRDLFLGHSMDDSGRATAGFKTPNALAGYLVIWVPLAFSLVFTREKKRPDPLFLWLFIMFLWAIAVTFSRAGWLAALAGMLFVLRFIDKKIALRVMFVSGLVLLGGLWAGHSRTAANFRLETDQVQGTWEWRRGLWQDTVSMIGTKPLFGHGINTFMPVFQEFRRKLNGQFYYEPTYAHNCYLQMAAETGVLGLAAFVWILYILFKTVLFTVRRDDPNDRGLAALLRGLTGGMLAFLLHSGFDTDFYSLKLVAWFWFAAALSMCLHNLLNAGSIHAIKRTP